MANEQASHGPLAFSPQELIEQFYLGLFDRQGDPGGLATYSDRISKSGESLAKILVEMTSSPEFLRKKTIRGTLETDSFAFWGHSQHGELQALLAELARTGSKHQYVVDVGARGRQRSNSFDLLSAFNWSGLLIEANPNLVQQIREDFKDTDYKIENVAISTYDGSAEFFIADNPDVSSLTEGAVRHWGGVADVVSIMVRRLPKVLEAYSVPFDFDVLSLDIEGEDVDVFNDLVSTSRYRPKYVFVEVHDKDDPGTLAGRGFCDIAIGCYNLLKRVGPNLFLSRIE